MRRHLAGRMMGGVMGIILGVTGLLGQQEERGGARAIPEEPHLRQGIVYKEVGGVKLGMLLFEPTVAVEGPVPWVIYFHGGGWASGDKTRVFRGDIMGVVRRLQAAGIACASADYRLTGGEGNKNTVMDAVADCKDAIRYLKKEAAQFGLEPERVGTFGGSAGGHLAMMTALAADALFPGDPALAGIPAGVRCGVSYYGPPTMSHPEAVGGSNFERPERWIPLIGGRPEEKPERVQLIRPITHLRRESVPLLVVNGLVDPVVPPRGAEIMRDRAAEIGAAVTTVFVAGAAHGFKGDKVEPSVPEINRLTVEFFQQHLQGEKP